MYMCSVAQSCPMLFAIPCTVATQAPLPVEFFQARILEQVVIFHSRGSSRPRNQIKSLTSPTLADRFFYHCATWETPSMFYLKLLLKQCNSHKIAYFIPGVIMY